MTNEATIYRIVLTGGPQGGKSTAIAQISEYLHSLGINVYVVPQATQLLFSEGVSLSDLPQEYLYYFYEELLKTIIAREDTLANIARATGKSTLLISEHGTMDVKTYINPYEWTTLLVRNSWSEAALRDERYSAVCHLVTAADGAEAFYKSAHDIIHAETPEQARLLDRRLQDSWAGHANVSVVDNSSEFDVKINQAVSFVCRIIGAPEPVQTERRFLVRQAPDLDEMPVYYQTANLAQIYLITQDGSVARVHRQDRQGAQAYFHAIKRPLNAGQRIKIEQRISKNELPGLLTQADPFRQTVRKERRTFMWEGRYFALDSFDEPYQGLQILETYLSDEKTEINLPPFIEIEKEVTDDEQYSNYAIAGGKLQR